MPLLLLLDGKRNRSTEYVLDADAQLPGLLHLGCSVRDYCGGAVPEVIWADTGLLRALDILADRCPLPLSVCTGLSFAHSLPFACGEGLILRAAYANTLPTDFVPLALSCGFTAASHPWDRWGPIRLYCSCGPWHFQPDRCHCRICFLQYALKKLGLSLPITGRLDPATRSALRYLGSGQMDQAALSADLPLLKHLFELTIPVPNATIQVAYDPGGAEHGL